MTALVRVTVPVAASQVAVWRELTTWENQGEWMPLTAVRSDGGDRVGGRIVARTGIGPLGFTDTMEITEWEPPHRCTVLHTGKVVRGAGVFVVEAESATASTLTWEEHLDLPWGPVGRLGWIVAGPIAGVALRRALRTFAARFADETS